MSFSFDEQHRFDALNDELANVLAELNGLVDETGMSNEQVRELVAKAIDLHAQIRTLVRSVTGFEV
jgi:hypothetical protein